MYILTKLFFYTEKNIQFLKAFYDSLTAKIILLLSVIMQFLKKKNYLNWCATTQRWKN